MIHYIFDKTLPKNLPLLFKKRAEENPDIKLQAYKNAQGKFYIIAIATNCKTM